MVVWGNLMATPLASDRMRLATRRATLRVGPAASAVRRARRKFLRFFPGGFRDSTYLAWERDYKWRAHRQWVEVLGPAPFQALLRREAFHDIAAHAVRIESRTNLLF